VLYRAASDPSSTTDQPARIGFVVSRQVGPAVVRNRVKRRLRHQVAARVDRLSSGALYVVRANPSAAAATSDQLGEALDACLDKVER
jgi:ribonuclease P protein component